MIHRHADVVTIHGYTNALQAWQGSNQEHAFPQGQVFMLPNATWGQPTFWVISMIADSFRPRVIELDPQWQTYGDPKVDVMAVCSEDGTSLVLRAANWDNSAATRLRIMFHDGLQLPTVVSVLLLRGSSGDPLEENDPGSPRRVSPQNRTDLFQPSSQTLTLPALSYVVVTFVWTPRSVPAEQLLPGWSHMALAVACGATALWGCYALAAAACRPSDP
jgi:hypothetical protein